MCDFGCVASDTQPQNMWWVTQGPFLSGPAIQTSSNAHVNAQNSAPRKFPGYLKPWCWSCSLFSAIGGHLTDPTIPDATCPESSCLGVRSRVVDPASPSGH